MYYLLCYFGIENSLKYHGNFNKETLKIVTGIDGLSLSKCSLSSFWQILYYFRHISSRPNVF